MFNIFEKVQIAVVAVLAICASLATGLAQVACGLGIILAVTAEVAVKAQLSRNGFYK